MSHETACTAVMPMSGTAFSQLYTSVYAVQHYTCKCHDQVMTDMM